jgi:broad specificity phosphatase PhoE
VILYLVRHGQTAHNRDGLGLGRGDVPLTSFGQRQVAALGKRLTDVHFERVLCSPLQRARQTAAAFANGTPIEPRDGLTEMDVGETEGMTFSEMRRKYPEFLAQWTSDRPDLVSMPGGESLGDVADRLIPVVDELATMNAEAVAFVSHNFTLKVLLCRLLELELPRFRAFTIGVASLSVINGTSRRWVIDSLNDNCHLNGLEP